MADQAPPEDFQSTASNGTDAAPSFPERLRVHALAKLLGVTSKQVIATLADLGEPTKNVQSSLTRESALAVQSALSGETPAAVDQAVEPAEPEAAAPAPFTQPNLFTSSPQPEIAEQSAEPVAAPSIPVFLQAEPAPETAAPRQRRSRRAATPPPETAEPVSEDAAVEPQSAQLDDSPSVDVSSTSEVTASDTSAEDTSQDPDDADDESDDASQPRRRRRGRRGRGRGRGEQGSDGDSNDDSDADTSGTSGSENSGSDLEASAGDDASSTDVDETAAVSDDSAEETTDDDGETSSRSERRPRRSRGRSRSRNADRAEASDNTSESDNNADGSAEDTNAAESDSADQDDFDDDENADGSSRRRRRRRRRKSPGEVAADGTTSVDDPPNTVVHEREPRAKARPKDEVQGISGSTRLEAKRQRRRDGRDAGRRRPPILTESEFLARRESVDRVMIVREKAVADQPLITQVAVLEDGILVEHFVTSSAAASMVGNVYLGRVQNVLPSMEAAFIDIGRGRNGVLYAGEVNWDAAGLGGSARKIEQALKPGDQVLVQVSKDPVGHKGARLTTQLSLAGRFLVYVPGGSSTGISRKLPDTERKRLKDLLRDIVPPEAGVIIRTAAEGVSEEELARDVTRLQAQWASIEDLAANAETGQGKQPQTLYEEPDMLVKVIRDLFNEDFSKVIIEGERAWETTSHYIETVAPDLLSRVERFSVDSGAHDVFGAHRIDEQLVKALDRKVWLPSGGTLVIDRTEAMTVVDVNTGKFTGAGGNLEETVTRNNLEAAEEIVRQMRLRDIGGMIVVDFIDMVLESNRDLILRRLTEALGRDRTRHQVSEVTSLGLVQMTRKKLGTGLVEAFSTTCEHCQGRGIMVHPFPVEVKADDGIRSAPARSESGGQRKNRRGRDKADVVAEDTTPTPADEHVGVDPSIKRAHPAALAMAAHQGHDESSVDSDALELPSIAAVESASDAAVDVEMADNDVAPADATVVSAADVEDDAVKPVVTRGRRSRRVVRKPAAPAGESPSAGTVFVVPNPPSEPADSPTSEPVDTSAPVNTTPQSDVVPSTAADSDIVVKAPVARPRRRRAAARPAGPPVDAEVS